MRRKALRPALAEMAGRTSQQLGPSTNRKDGRREAQYDALVVELEKVQDSNLARRVASHETYQQLKAVSVQHETAQEMITIENQYRVIDLSVLSHDSRRSTNFHNRKGLMRSVKAASST